MSETPLCFQDRECYYTTYSNLIKAKLCKAFVKGAPGPYVTLPLPGGYTALLQEPPRLAEDYPGKLLALVLREETGTMLQGIRNLWPDERGLTTVEYSLLLVLVAVIAFTAWQTFGKQ